MRLIFVKHTLAFPRSSGHDVITYYMMKACRALGHEIALATVDDSPAAAVHGLDLDARFALGADTAATAADLTTTRLQRKFRSYWGIRNASIAALARAARDWRADVVVVGGLDALPYFPALAGVIRVWYAADECVLHHCSQIKLRNSQLRTRIQAAAVQGFYERVHRRVIDRAWVVTESDAKAMRWIAGVRNVDVLPIGVDCEYFRPSDAPATPDTAVFWGRLDFGPNVQALEWFCSRVWPLVRRDVPNGRFTIMGFNPARAITRLAALPGVQLRPNVPDLRGAACEHAVAVLPMISGAGMKNKLLEAAALGIPIVCTPTATLGLQGGRLPLHVVSQPDAFASAIVRLWRDPNRAEFGAAARAWVMEHHAWETTARKAIGGLEQQRNVRSDYDFVAASSSATRKS